MEIEQFAQFRMIAECGTMREAAERLYISQPTLSYNIKKLETELGCKLFFRAHNRLRLTPYGEIALKHVRVLQDHMDEMLAEIEDTKRHEAETLRIGCFSNLVASLLMPHLASDLSDMSFDVTCCPTDDLVEGLKTGRFDAVIGTEIVSRKDFKALKLYVEQAFASMPEEAGTCEVLHSEDLRGLRFNIEAGAYGYTDWFSHVLSQAGVAQDAIEFMPLREHLIIKDSLPTTNLITSFIMRFVQVAKGRVIAPIDEPFASRTVSLHYRGTEKPQLAELVSVMYANIDHFISGNAFVPYLMFPNEAGNLRIKGD